MPTPLRKTKPTGEIYTRRPKIEAILTEILSFSREAVLTRCKIQDRDDLGYIPNECLLYLIRSYRTEKPNFYFEDIYKILAARILFCLPKGDKQSDTLIREETFGRFNELLAGDRNTYQEKLDYYEVSFEHALKLLRLDVQDQVWRDDSRTVPLEAGPEASALSDEVEQAAIHRSPYDTPKIIEKDYRLRLNTAIKSLPSLQRQIIEMIRQEIPIDSKDPDAITIANTLGKSEKTIRTHRDSAYATLRRALPEGELS